MMKSLSETGIRSLIVILSCLYYVNAITIPLDVAALKLFQTALSPQSAFSTWVGDPCSENWKGIECSSGEFFQTVISINLQNMDLEGQISESVGNLVHLRVLSLENNKLSGRIPRSIGNSNFLTHLHLRNNRLVGSIPVELGKLHMLESLTLNGNQFTGVLPFNLSNLPNLKHLDVSETTLERKAERSLSMLGLVFSKLRQLFFVTTKPHSTPILAVESVPDDEGAGDEIRELLDLAAGPAVAPSQSSPPLRFSPPITSLKRSPPIRGRASPSPPPIVPVSAPVTSPVTHSPPLHLSPPPLAVAPAPSSPPPASHPPSLPPPQQIAPAPGPTSIPSPSPPLSPPTLPPPSPPSPPPSPPPSIAPLSAPPPPPPPSPSPPPPSSPLSTPIGFAFPPPPPLCNFCGANEVPRPSSCECVFPLFAFFRLTMEFTAFTPVIENQFLSELASNMNTSVDNVDLLSKVAGSVITQVAFLPTAPDNQFNSTAVVNMVNVLTGANGGHLSLSSVFGSVSVLNVTLPSLYGGVTASPPPPPSSASSNSSSSGLSIGAIIGIVVGAVIISLVVVLCVIIVLCCSRTSEPRPVPDAGKDYAPPRSQATGASVGGWTQGGPRGTPSPTSRGPATSGTPLISKRESRDAPAAVTAAGLSSSPASVTGPSPQQTRDGAVAPVAVAPSRKDSSPGKRGSIVGAQAFIVSDLQVATKSFSDENLIGEGPMGSLYRADFAKGRALAIKRVKPSAVDGMSDEDFKGIVQNMARLRHPNIVELHGYCVQHGQRLLAFQYFPEGNLYDFLQDPKRRPYLTWDVRVKIAIGCARGLEYIHELITPPIVHRKFKSTNVQLDKDLNPHVADGGMAVFNPIGVDTMSQGGFTYSAPEYTMSGVYTIASDVYSFGVVLLELLTGRMPIDLNRPKAEQSLVKWAAPLLSDYEALEEILDPKLTGERPSAVALARFAEVTTRCLQNQPELRPPMSKVASDLAKKLGREG